MIKSLAAIAALSLSSFAFAAGPVPEVVKQVDLNQYAGRWYEIASSKPIFQKDCVCTTADYTLQADNSVKVVNTCRQKTVDGALNQVEGVAKLGSAPAKLKVSFGGFESPFSNYWIVDLADDYRYAVVSSFLRDPIFILSRTPELSAEDMATIRAHLQKDGFNLLKLKPTVQEACSYTE